MLFILVADTLSTFLKASQQDMPQHIRIAPKTIQFTDDTVIISEAHPTTLKIITRTLKVYARLSGLKINRSKSSFVPIAIPNHLIGAVQNILSSPPSQLPITYLGLPLSIKKPNKIDYQPMLASIRKVRSCQISQLCHTLLSKAMTVRNRLEGWKSKFLSYGGRLTLVNAVLTAMPLHYMQALKIPKGIVKHIERMRRSFLWKGNDTCRCINCLVNWEKVCSRKENGGMGIINLECQNDALLKKWLWNIGHSPNGLWSTTLQELYGITGTSQLSTATTSSYFLKDLTNLLPFFTASLTHDEITHKWIWRWSPTQLFTCNLAYNMMRNSRVRSEYHKTLWKLKVPLKVRVFIWLMLENKILTQEVLTTRGCTVPFGCQMCNSADIETRDHLLWDRSYANGF